MSEIEEYVLILVINNKIVFLLICILKYFYNFVIIFYGL